MHQGFADLSLTTWVWHQGLGTVEHNRFLFDNQGGMERILCNWTGCCEASAILDLSPFMAENQVNVPFSFIGNVLIVFSLTDECF